MIHEIDPLVDVRWPRFLARQQFASVFHSREWLEALYRTYGYPAVALTSSAPREELNDAVVFCRVQSWLTGGRLVSLPFSDHCTPLVDRPEQLELLLSHLKNECDRGRRKYVEIRPPTGQWPVGGFSRSTRFHLHRLDLRPSLDELFGRLHASCVRRRLSRARRAGFFYEEGRSEALLDKLYRLAVMTRRRQNLPPQPLAWFRNLVSCLGQNLKIRIVTHASRPAAGILTLRFGGTMTYKYGFSDPAFHALGSMQLLLWKAIEDAKQEGLVEFDMGRSDWKDDGLVRFKNRWGCVSSPMSYLRYPEKMAQPEGTDEKNAIVRRFFAVAPDTVLVAAGNMLYRHMA